MYTCVQRLRPVKRERDAVHHHLSPRGFFSSLFFLPLFPPGYCASRSCGSVLLQDRHAKTLDVARAQLQLQASCRAARKLSRFTSAVQRFTSSLLIKWYNALRAHVCPRPSCQKTTVHGVHACTLSYTRRVRHLLGRALGPSSEKRDDEEASLKKCVRECRGKR